MIVRNILKYGLFLIAFTLCRNGLCSCNYTHGQGYVTKTVNFGDVVVQRDSPVGTVLAKADTGSFNPSYGDYFICYNSWTFAWELQKFTTQSVLTGVYDTNIPGIGIKMVNAEDTLIPYQKSHPPTGNINIPNVEVTLIKTSADSVSSGSISTGVIVKAEAVGIQDIAQVNMGSSNIIPVKCAITTPSLKFPLGSVPISEFGQSVGFTPVETSTQNLGLNCDAGANINVTLNAVQNSDVADTSVLALNGQGEPGIASGLGVQLLYGDKPIEINKNIVMKTSAEGQEMLPITARYYQTRSLVSAGDASTSATMAITYQ